MPLRITCIAFVTIGLLHGQIPTMAGAAGNQTLTQPASSTPPEQRCSLQGRVSNAQTGEPIKKAQISLTQNGKKPGTVGAVMAGMEGYSTTSAADGSFEFDNIEPGEYSLSGERPGFLRTEYRSRDSLNPGVRISLSPSQHLSGVALTLIPQSVISGKVVDEDGDPAGNLMVMALQQSWTRGKEYYFPGGNVNTDEEGQFRIANLRPGKYYLCAQKMNSNDVKLPATPDKPDMRPVRTFYPDSTTRDAASALTIRAGESLTGIEIHLRSVATHHIRGKVAGDLPDSGHAMLQLRPADEDFPFFFSAGPAMIKPDRSFDIPGIAPGRYLVSVMQFSGNPRDFAQATVEVGASDVNEVVLAPLPAFELRGQIALQGAPSSGTAAVNLKSAHVMVFPADRQTGFFGGQSQTNENGSFTVQNLSPGKYQISVVNPSGTYVKSIQYGSQDVLGKELDLTQGGGGELQVLLRYGTAEVGGTVTAAGNSGNTGAQQSVNASVVLIAEPLPADGHTLTASTDQNAAFSIKNVPPGKYYAIAVEDFDYRPLQNPDFTKALASKGVEIELQENEKKQLQLPLTTAAEVRQMMARLGMEPEQ